MLPGLAHWCYRHRRFVVVAWIVALVAISILGKTAGGTLEKTFSLPGTESQRTFDVLGQDFQRKGDTGDLVFQVNGGGTVNDPAVRTAVSNTVNQLKQMHPQHVVSVTTPYDPGGAALHLAGRQDRLRRDPVRRAGERRARRSRDAHARRW